MSTRPSYRDANIFENELISDQLAPGEIHTWHFRGSTEQTITVVLDVISEESELSNNISLSLNFENGDSVEDAILDQNQLRINNLILPNNGWYYLEISSLIENSNATYNLLLTGSGGTRPEEPPCQVPPASCPITSPFGISGIEIYDEVPTSGSVTGASPLNVYQFLALEGDIINLEVVRSGGDLDTFLGLADKDGNILARDDGADPESSTINNYSIPSDGCYFAVVSRADVNEGETEGTFILTASGIPSAPEEEVPSLPGNYVIGDDITSGETIRGTIDGENWQMAYRFRPENGGSFVASATRSSGDLNPALVLLDAEGNELSRVTANLMGNESNPLEFTTESDSYYFIVVQREGGESGATSGDFALTLSQ